MSSIANSPLSNRKSYFRLSLIIGLIIGATDMIIYNWLVTSVLGGVPFVSLYQYIASGALGESAFAGGMVTHCFYRSANPLFH